MAKYLCEKAGLDYSIFNSAFLAIKGSVIPMDATHITRQSGPPIYSFMSVAWGIVADVDIESEACRACGPCRFDMYAGWRSVKLIRYRGRVSIWQGETSSALGGSDIAIVVTLHDALDQQTVLASAPYVFDTTGKLKGAKGL